MDAMNKLIIGIPLALILIPVLVFFRFAPTQAIEDAPALLIFFGCVILAIMFLIGIGMIITLISILFR